MKARKRFLLLFVAFLAFIHFGVNRMRRTDDTTDDVTNDTLLAHDNHYYDFERTFGRKAAESAPNRRTGNECRMSSCFDFTRCRDSPQNGLKIHLYPDFGHKLSPSFAKIVEIIKTSKYYESDPNKACLFVTTVWDTVDRDPLSQDFQKPSPAMTSFTPLFGARNHLLFNLYSGSWPQYRELDFSFGHNYGPIAALLDNAILVKASQSRQSYRPDFDVSLPLFARNHPTRGPAFSPNTRLLLDANTRTTAAKSADRRKREKYLLVFKGKRYTYGIGSETRNALHFLHNGNDVIVLTTCRHGKKWRDLKDDKCETDDALYDSHDYQQLMANATFCLVPRGRRLGSYRFLEALQFGCIPVVLANQWLLPFHELLDWTQCAVVADERLLLQTTETLRQISRQKIAEMRAKCLALYETYFSSVERIVLTSLLVIEQRLRPHLALQHFVWNLRAPPLAAVVTQSQLGVRDPRLNALLMAEEVNDRAFTAVVHVTTASDVTPNLQRLIGRALRGSRFAAEAVVVWPQSLALPAHLVETPFVRVLRSNASARFRLVDSTTLKTDCVLQLSPHSLLSAKEFDFGFSVWTAFPRRVVGFSSRDHFFDDQKRQFEYSSKWTNQYSLVLSDSAFHHKAFNDLFSSFYSTLDPQLALDSDSECADFAFSFLVSHVTREGALKVTQRKRTTNTTSSWLQWSQRKLCFERLQHVFGYLPLIQSRVRFDPLLFRDAVSVKRKKYRKLETVL